MQKKVKRITLQCSNTKLSNESIKSRFEWIYLTAAEYRNWNVYNGKSMKVVDSMATNDIFCILINRFCCFAWSNNTKTLKSNSEWCWLMMMMMMLTKFTKNRVDSAKLNGSHVFLLFIVRLHWFASFSFLLSFL